MQKTAIAYVRVSTLQQNLEVQLDQVQIYAKLQDLKLLNVYMDKATGSNIDRTGYQHMLEVLDKNQLGIEVVVVSKLDRVGRSIRDLLTFIDFLQKRNITFVSITDSIDSGTAQGRLFLYIIGALSEYERELIAERTALGRKKFIQDGGRLGKPKKKLDMVEIKRLLSEGVPKLQVCKKFKISAPTLYSRLAEEKK